MTDPLTGMPLVGGSLTQREDGNKFNFQYNPQSLNSVVAASWAEQRVPGKMHPIYQYAGGLGRVLTFTLVLYSHSAGSTDVDTQVAWLESLTFPDITGNNLKDREPPRCLLFLGANKTFNVVLKEVRVVHDLFYANLNTRYATVDVTALEDEPKAVGYRDVRL